LLPSISQQIERFLAGARVRGERWIAIARAVVCVLVPVRILALAHHDSLGGNARVWGLLGVCAAGGAYSMYTARSIRLGSFKHRWVWLSIAVDAALVFSGLFVEVMRPLPGYGGILRTPEYGLALVALLASALRLSSRLVVLGIALNAVSLVALTFIDRAYVFAHGPAVAFTAGIYYACGSVVAYALASRTERLVLRGAQAVLNAERARMHLGAYVSTEIAETLLTSDQLALGGERRPVAVLFSDLRGFTRYAESLPPEQLVAELNAYLDAMLPVIREHGGVVDKYIGDAIMVVFGVPSSRGDEAVRAVRTARDMQAALARHNEARAQAGRTPLVQGIGVHYGPVIAGNIGTPDRLQYTVVGDAVNIASRLESATKEHKVSVLLSNDVVEAAADPALRERLRAVGTVDIRGRSGGLAAYTFAA
jgi:class 3 adenylate cyclase